METFPSQSMEYFGLLIHNSKIYIVMIVRQCEYYALLPTVRATGIPAIHYSLISH